ncbi:hypothetical protein FY136_06050 [Agrobacterium tumefaciens]|uniref:pyocin knob domain-containing protein n=1 Tax=Agrobacterium tumefaciens TaxID=358 RepID=UPI0021CE734A|nr:pyocin knob domain-containing protein [Agrobacterium tumefaciens]UXT48826.1 hypothetical protein FY136_06050 [Agrobacterium tumefaciens]
MAGVAYYNTGTATVAANSKTVTGTGTNWLSTVGGLTAIKAGDKFGIHVGRPIIIASVDSNTQLTLEDNWPGPAQTNAAYRIELTSPDVIAVEALRRMLGSLSSGVLYGLSQLPSTPSKALTIDENGSAALADMGATGKSLLASLNSSAAYGVLGVIPNVQLPTRIRALSTAVTDADTVLENGSYAVAPTASNIPEAVAGTLIVGMYTAFSYGVQFYVRLSSSANNVWYRARSNGNWLPWKRMDGDLSGPGAAVANNALVGFNGTSGYLTKALTTLEALANLGPVAGGIAPEPAAAGVGMANGDFDTLTYPGEYTIGGSWTNGPNGPNGAAAANYVGVLKVQARSYNNLYIHTLRLSNGVVYKRYGSSGPAWNAWERTEDASTAASRALLALTPAANKFPYFTSGSAAALGDITTFARSVLDDASGAAMFATMGADQLLSANGWVKLPNGLIIQWGQGSAGSGTATIAFPMAFPNACYGVTLGTEISNTTAAELYTTHVSSKTLTNFVLNGRFVVGGSVGAGGVPANYIAIGR